MMLLKKLFAVSVFVFASVFAVATPTYAALDPAVATSFTAIETDFAAMMALAWPVIGAVIVALAIVGLVRKALSRGGVR